MSRSGFTNAEREHCVCYGYLKDTSEHKLKGCSYMHIADILQQSQPFGYSAKTMNWGLVHTEEEIDVQELILKYGIKYGNV